MKTLLLALLLAIHPESDPAREAALTRELIEDAAIRFDDAALALGRERAARLAAAMEAAGDTRLARDAHELIALAAYAQVFTGNNDLATLHRVVDEGIRHADRAAALDEHDASALALAAAVRGGAITAGLAGPEARAALADRFGRALKLDPNAPLVAMLTGLVRSTDPAGPAKPEGVKAFMELVQRLDAERLAQKRRAGFLDVTAHYWLAFVELQALAPDAAAMRGPIAEFAALRPDSALARLLAARVEHRSWAPAAAVEALSWKTVGTDPAGDGKTPGSPELRSLEVARDSERMWFRLTYEQPLPQSFGLNVVIDRDGDPSGDMKWWGGNRTSRFRFDRLVTAWITREGDGYFGQVGITDADGARVGRFVKLSGDVALRLGADGKSVIAGVPLAVLELAPGARVIAAGGTHLVWNDDLTGPDGEGIELPVQ